MKTCCAASWRAARRSYDNVFNSGSVGRDKRAIKIIFPEPVEGSVQGSGNSRHVFAAIQKHADCLAVVGWRGVERSKGRPRGKLSGFIK